MFDIFSITFRQFFILGPRNVAVWSIKKILTTVKNACWARVNCIMCISRQRHHTPCDVWDREKIIRKTWQKSKIRYFYDNVIVWFVLCYPILFVDVYIFSFARLFLFSLTFFYQITIACLLLMMSIWCIVEFEYMLEKKKWSYRKQTEKVIVRTWNSPWGSFVDKLNVKLTTLLMSTVWWFRLYAISVEI